MCFRDVGEGGPKAREKFLENLDMDFWVAVVSSDFDDLVGRCDTGVKCVVCAANVKKEICSKLEVVLDGVPVISCKPIQAADAILENLGLL